LLVPLKLNNFSSAFIYFLDYVVLILIFNRVYGSIIINPNRTAKILRKMGSSIPGIRPGKDTEDYLQKTLNRLTFLGALFLGCLTVVPDLLGNVTRIRTFQSSSSTSIMIVTGVVIEISKKIQAYMRTKKYEDMIDQ